MAPPPPEAYRDVSAYFQWYLRVIPLPVRKAMASVETYLDNQLQRVLGIKDEEAEHIRSLARGITGMARPVEPEAAQPTETLVAPRPALLVPPPVQPKPEPSVPPQPPSYQGEPGSIVAPSAYSEAGDRVTFGPDVGYDVPHLPPRTGAAMAPPAAAAALLPQELPAPRAGASTPTSPKSMSPVSAHGASGGSVHASDEEAAAAFEAGLGGTITEETEAYREGASPARGTEAPAPTRGAPAASPKPAAAAISAAVAATLPSGAAGCPYVSGAVKARARGVPLLALVLFMLAVSVAVYATLRHMSSRRPAAPKPRPVWAAWLALLGLANAGPAAAVPWPAQFPAAEWHHAVWCSLVVAYPAYRGLQTLDHIHRRSLVAVDRMVDASADTAAMVIEQAGAAAAIAAGRTLDGCATVLVAALAFSALLFVRRLFYWLHGPHQAFCP